jgi:general secretion pathway protein F
VQNFSYKALTQAGEIVTGSLAAGSTTEVNRRIEYLGLVLIEAKPEAQRTASGSGFSFGGKPKAEDVTVFTRDLALLLKAGARIDGALDLLSTDVDVGRLRPTVRKIRAGVVGGETFADALAKHPTIFPPVYQALVRVGETSGALDSILDALATERARSEALRRKVTQALSYPAFVLFGAGCVLVFFLMFVLPQFGAVLRDFGAKLDPIVATFLSVSDFLKSHGQTMGAFLLVLIVTAWLFGRRPGAKQAFLRSLTVVPFARSILTLHMTGLFCRNLGVLLTSGMTLSGALRILSEMMESGGYPAAWRQVMERVRQGGKLSDALATANALPTMAVRMLKLGEETGQLPVLASRIADFYEAKLQRSLDRVVAIIGPAAIVTISIVVGGLIVSVMSSLMSVTQVVG